MFARRATRCGGGVASPIVSGEMNTTTTRDTILPPRTYPTLRSGEPRCLHPSSATRLTWLTHPQHQTSTLGQLRLATMPSHLSRLPRPAHTQPSHSPLKPGCPLDKSKAKHVSLIRSKLVTGPRTSRCCKYALPIANAYLNYVSCSEH